MNFEEELKKKAEGRQQFLHQGQLVYEWDQGLEDVNVFIKPPPFLVPKYRKQYEAGLKPGQKLPKIEIAIGKTGLKVGMTGSPPFLDVTPGQSRKSTPRRSTPTSPFGSSRTRKYRSFSRRPSKVTPGRRSSKAMARWTLSLSRRSKRRSCWSASRRKYVQAIM
jgi:hypothetical protein